MRENVTMCSRRKSLEENKTDRGEVIMLIMCSDSSPRVERCWLMSDEGNPGQGAGESVGGPGVARVKGVMKFWCESEGAQLLWNAGRKLATQVFPGRRTGLGCAMEESVRALLWRGRSMNARYCSR
jgi:hypothetical protein